MRKIRVLMVITVLAAATSVPAVAQAQIEAPAWGSGTVAERVVGWIEGLWRAVAGSETEPVPPGDGGETVDGGPGDVVTSEDPLPTSDLYPEFDPDG